VTETTADMANPQIRECAGQLARELHDTGERKRCPVRHLERYGWDEIPAEQQHLMIRAVYSLLYRGLILCPVPAHRIGIGLRAPEPTENKER
jgi:hypothetical protein